MRGNRGNQFYARKGSGKFLHVIGIRGVNADDHVLFDGKGKNLKHFGREILLPDIHAANRRMGVRIDDLYFGVPQYTIPVSQRFSSILASKWVIRRAPPP